MRGPDRGSSPASVFPQLDSARPRADDPSRYQPHGPRMNSYQKAEAAEHAMMEELERAVYSPDAEDRIVVKAAIYTSGERDPREPAENPRKEGQALHHGPRQAAAEDARQADAVRLLQAAFRARQHAAPDAKRPARAEARRERKNRARLPAARHRQFRLHPRRSRLLERPARGALRGSRGEPGPSSITRLCGSFRTSPRATSIPRRTRGCSARTTRPSPSSTRPTAKRAITSGTCPRA